jgi:hypothetical protein
VRMRRPRSRRHGAYVVFVAALLMAVQAATASAGTTKFGSKVSANDSQPHPGQYCSNDHETNCTWVLVEGYHNPDRTNAPRDGVIDKIRLVASGPGTFKLFIARAKPNSDEAKIVRAGPIIEYEGGRTVPPYNVETFNVNVPVNEGDYLAIRAKRPKFLNCSGQQVLTYQPPLPVGGPFEESDPNSPGCTLLLQAIME